MLIWLSIAYAQDKDVSEQIVGNCDEQNVCVVNFNNSDFNNRLKIENASGFFNSRDAEHATHKVSLADKDRLLYLLNSLQKWHSI